MKKLLVKCLMVMSILGILLSVQSIQLAGADNDCDIDSQTIKAIDSTTVRFRFDSSACDGFTLQFYVEKAGTDILLGQRFFSSPGADNVILEFGLNANQAFKNTKPYEIEMWTTIGGGSAILRDRDSFFACWPPQCR